MTITNEHKVAVWTLPDNEAVEWLVQQGYTRQQSTDYAMSVRYEEPDPPGVEALQADKGQSRIVQGKQQYYIEGRGWVSAEEAMSFDPSLILGDTPEEVAEDRKSKIGKIVLLAGAAVATYLFVKNI